MAIAVGVGIGCVAGVGGRVRGQGAVLLYTKIKLFNYISQYFSDLFFLGWGGGV